MTDKQIIIDGVDVAKCRCFTSEWDFNNCGHICKGTECKYKRLWYKKQLQAKEQECEELKEELHQNFKEKDRLHLIIDRLLEASGYDTNTASAEDFEDVYENMRYEKQQLYQLKQTLQEIKEIAENMNEECFCDDFDCMNCDMQNGCTYFNKKQILQKISGCEI